MCDLSAYPILESDEQVFQFDPQEWLKLVDDQNELIEKLGTCQAHAQVHGGVWTIQHRQEDDGRGHIPQEE